MLPFVTSCMALVAITYGADTALLRTEELELLKPAMDCSKCWECFGCMDGGTRCMPIPGCVPSGCESNSDCGRGQKCENGQCSAATIHCVYDSDCLTEDHYCDNGVCELRWFWIHLYFVFILSFLLGDDTVYKSHSDLHGERDRESVSTFPSYSYGLSVYHFVCGQGVEQMVNPQVNRVAKGVEVNQAADRGVTAETEAVAVDTVDLHHDQHLLRLKALRHSLIILAVYGMEVDATTICVI